MDAYSITLFIHSWLRWVVLGLLGAVVVRSALATRRGGAWSRTDERLHVAAVASVDVQLLVGLLLYVALSPMTSAFFAAPGAAMRDSTLRFFGVEHLTSMLLGLAILHVGRVRSKKRVPPAHRHRTVFRWTLAALVCVLVGVPWPFLPYARPLVRADVGALPTTVNDASAADRASRPRSILAECPTRCS